MVEAALGRQREGRRWRMGCGEPGWPDDSRRRCRVMSGGRFGAGRAGGDDRRSKHATV
jgi:hypothetical protein